MPTSRRLPVGPNYLKREYRARVLRGPVRYQLQIQLCPLSDITHDETFNASADRDEREIPWRPLAEVCIDETMRRPEGNLVRFSIGHQPGGLGLFRARSPFDYHSLNHLRAASSWAKRARVASYALHGMPDPISEVRGEPHAWRAKCQPMPGHAVPPGSPASRMLRPQLHGGSCVNASRWGMARSTGQTDCITGTQREDNPAKAS